MQIYLHPKYWVYVWAGLFFLWVERAMALDPNPVIDTASPVAGVRLGADRDSFLFYLYSVTPDSSGLADAHDSANANGLPDSTGARVAPRRFVSDLDSMEIIPAALNDWLKMTADIPTEEESAPAPAIARPGLFNKFTFAFLLLILGMFVIAADRDQFRLLVQAYLKPRLFEQYLRQQRSPWTGWSWVRIFFFFVLLSAWISLLSLQSTWMANPSVLGWVKLLALLTLGFSLLFAIHFLMGVAFNHLEWVIGHIGASLTFLQVGVPVAMVAVFLAGTLPTRLGLPIQAGLAVVLALAWHYRLILGWNRALQTKGMGLGYIILYFCLLEILPFLLLLKFASAQIR